MCHCSTSDVTKAEVCTNLSEGIYIYRYIYLSISIYMEQILFQPMLNNWCNEDHGIYYPVCRWCI